MQHRQGGARAGGALPLGAERHAAAGAREGGFLAAQGLSVRGARRGAAPRLQPSLSVPGRSARGVHRRSHVSTPKKGEAKPRMRGVVSHQAPGAPLLEPSHPQNRVTELYSQIRFLRIFPFAVRTAWG